MNVVRKRWRLRCQKIGFADDVAGMRVDAAQRDD
ncbi:protein of unknown function [Burkholderia multivorans]